MKNIAKFQNKMIEINSENIYNISAFYEVNDYYTGLSNNFDLKSINPLIRDDFIIETTSSHGFNSINRVELVFGRIYHFVYLDNGTYKPLFAIVDSTEFGIQDPGFRTHTYKKVRFEIFANNKAARVYRIFFPIPYHGKLLSNEEEIIFFKEEFKFFCETIKSEDLEDGLSDTYKDIYNQYKELI
jgi:hypothetical protein